MERIKRKVVVEYKVPVNFIERKYIYKIVFVKLFISTRGNNILKKRVKICYLVLQCLPKDEL